MSLLERRNAEMHALLEAIPAAVFITHDRDCSSITGNRAAYEMMNVTNPDECPNLSPTSCRRRYQLFADDRELATGDYPLQYAAASGNPVRDVELEMVWEDGTRKRILGNAVPIHDAGDEVRGAVAVFLDVTDRKRWEAELHDRDARLRDALMAANMVAWVRDLHTSEVKFSENVTQFYGEISTDASELIKFVHPDDRAQLQQAVAGALIDGTPYNAEFRVIMPDGRVRWIADQGSVHTDSSGRPERLTGVSVDITERKMAENALRQSEQRFASFMQHLPGAAWMKDLKGRYVYANHVAEKSYGLAGAELYGKTDYDLFPPEVAAQLMCSDRTVVKTGESLQTLEDLYARFEVRHSLVTKFPIRDHTGNVALVAGVAVDVTERKKYEEELKSSTQQLAEANRHKDEFLAMLAHELRNPLAPIRNGLFILQQPGATPAQLRSTQEMMKRQVEHMTRLIDDLLDVARVSRGKILLQKVRLNLTDLLHAVVNDNFSAFSKAGRGLGLDAPVTPLYVMADATRLTQILDNLLNNALKFTHPGDRVTLSVQADSDEKFATISVADTGIGIEQSMLTRVFDAFTQSSQGPDRSRGGLGLGLALVKGLIELHAGTVSAESNGPGQGSRFIIRLPLCDSSGVFQEHHEEHTNAAYHILLIEDNPDSAETLKLVLELNGHTVELASNGREGIVKASSFKPGIIICDIGLPGDTDGYAVARAVREDHSLSPHALIALSGYGQAEDKKRALAAGFDAHLTKPIDPARLEILFSELAPHAV
jgi:PAS domain S-box-containing protein